MSDNARMPIAVPTEVLAAEGECALLRSRSQWGQFQVPHPLSRIRVSSLILGNSFMLMPSLSFNRDEAVISVAREIIRFSLGVRVKKNLAEKTEDLSECCPSTSSIDNVPKLPFLFSTYFSILFMHPSPCKSSSISLILPCLPSPVSHPRNDIPYSLRPNEDSLAR